MEPYTKVMFTITKFGLQVLYVHADVLKYSTKYFTNEIVPICTAPRRGRYYDHACIPVFNTTARIAWRLTCMTEQLYGVRRC